MKNTIARGGIEFLAVLLGLSGSLSIDSIIKEKDQKEQNTKILKSELRKSKNPKVQKSRTSKQKAKILRIFGFLDFVQKSRQPKTKSNDSGFLFCWLLSKNPKR